MAKMHSWMTLNCVWLLFALATSPSHALRVVDSREAPSILSLSRIPSFLSRDRNQQVSIDKDAPTPGQNITVGPFIISLTASQTLSLLALAAPSVRDGFAFSRGAGGPTGLGDATIRARPAAWRTKTRPIPREFASMRPYPLWSGWRTTAGGAVALAPNSSAVVAEADLTKSLQPEHGSEGAASPFIIKRTWETGTDGRSLLLRLKVTNNVTEAVEVGAVGFPLPFPWHAGSPAGDEASTFLDPSVGAAHGYATVTRLSGKHEVLLVAPGSTSGGQRSRLEAWRSAKELGGGGGILGIQEWLCLSKAYAQAEWVEAGKQWVEPSSVVLSPRGTANASAEFVLSFSVAADVRSKDPAIRAAGGAVVLGVPGYVLGADMTTSHLLVQPPDGATLLGAESDEAALAVGAVEAGAAAGWVRVPLRATADGRPRLTLRYSDGSAQVVSYRTLPPFSQHLETYSGFQSSIFFTAPDPFRRSPAFLPWDRQLARHVLDDPRNFVVGLSDEAGAGANVGFAAKQRYRPRQAELNLLGQYIDHTLHGQQLDGAGVPVSLQEPASHGIKASMFWSPLKNTNETGMPGYNYPPEDFEGWQWDRARADSLGRAYNYPHQTSVYHSMYRALRGNDKLSASHPAEWYLDAALNTTLAMWSVSRWYAQMGLMVGTVFLDLLGDLEAAAHPQAAAVREIMYNRTAVGVTFYSSASCNKNQCACYNCTYASGNATTDCPNHLSHSVYQCPAWANNPFPFGSEFAWDSTGQEEEYIWGRYFGQVAPWRNGGSPGSPKGDALANLTLAAVLAYLPSVPHWAYNGAALSWGDTGNNAKWTDSRRVAGHYRATLNAIPVMAQWMMEPDDWYLLPPAIGAASLHLTTIDGQGAASMGFYLDPEILDLDPYSGDFGIGFWGHARLAASYFVQHPQHGPLCFFCDAAPAPAPEDGLGGGGGGGQQYSITPRDSMRRQVFLEPLGVLLEAASGDLLSVDVDLAALSFTVHLADAGTSTKFRLKVSVPSLRRPASRRLVQITTPGSVQVRGLYELPLSATAVAFKLEDTGDPLRAAPGGTLEPSAPAPKAVKRPNTESPATHSTYNNTRLNGTPELKDVAGGFASATAEECAAACARHPPHLSCQAWSYAHAEVSPHGQAWCWLLAGRGVATGSHGYVSATCDNQPSPPSIWPCCDTDGGFNCPDPISL